MKPRPILALFLLVPFVLFLAALVALWWGTRGLG